MTVSTRLPRHLRANALALHDMLAMFQERRMKSYVELMTFHGKLLRWTKPSDDCFLVPSPGLVVNDLGQLGRVKKDIMCHLAELDYERFKMEEIVKLTVPGISRETYTQGQFAALRAVATRYSRRPSPHQGPGSVRYSGKPPRRAQ